MIFVRFGYKKSLGSSFFGAWADFHWNCERSFEYSTVDVELNLTRPRIGPDLQSCIVPAFDFWVGILRDWNFNSFLFKENIKWQEYFYELFKTNIDCSLIGKLCKITPVVDCRPWAYISLDFVSENIVAHGPQSPRGVILHNFPHEQSIFVYYLEWYTIGIGELVSLADKRSNFSKLNLFVYDSNFTYSRLAL